MLRSFSLGNFKSYEEAKLKLAPLTVLIGANASGKSNALEGLRLLSWLAQGNRLSSIRYAVYEGDQAIRGTVSTLGRYDAQNFTLSCTINGKWDQYRITLALGADKDLHIEDERIVSPFETVPLYEVVGRAGGGGTDLRVAYNNFARGGKKPQVICNDHTAVLHQLQSAVRFEAGHKSAQKVIPDACAQFQDALSGILFLDPQPSAMRKYSFKLETKLSGDGQNISGVLFNLCVEKKLREDVLDFVRSLPEQNISGIGFVETPRGEAMVELEETFGGVSRKFDATLLSDGTLRVLSIAAAVMSAAEGSLVVIEEIDNGVHPSRVSELLNRILCIANRRKLRVLISSHNPALLDALPEDAVPDVLFCYRRPTDGLSSVIRLGDLRDLPELLAQGSVGHLMTDGIIEHFVKYQPTPEAKAAVAEAWLQNLRRRTE